MRARVRGGMNKLVATSIIIAVNQVVRIKPPAAGPPGGNGVVAEAGWRRLIAAGLAGRTISPYPFAGQGALRNKKTPTGSGVQKLANYYTRKSAYVKPTGRIFLKNLPVIVSPQRVSRGPLPRIKAIRGSIRYHDRKSSGQQDNAPQILLIVEPLPRLK